MDLNKLKKIPSILYSEGPYGLWWRLMVRLVGDPYLNNFQKTYTTWYQKYAPTNEIILSQKEVVKSFTFKPLISILTPTYNTDPKLLRACIESVLAQSYDNWELCIVDDASIRQETLEVLQEFKMIPQIKIIYRKQNGHISAASNDALALAKGEWIALLDHDDYLWPNALFEVVKMINSHPETAFIYSDEDKITEDGSRHCDPFFKPDWSPHFLWSCNYITHFVCLKRSLAMRAGGFTQGMEGAQDWDLFLRATSILEKQVSSHPWKLERSIRHIDTILYSWRKSATSTASEKHSLTAKNYAYPAQKRVLKSFFKERGGAEISPTRFLGIYDVNLITGHLPLISIVIPTNNQLKLIKKLITSISRSTFVNYEVLIVESSTSTESQAFYGTLDNSIYKVFHWNKEFNFSAICNFGARKAAGEILVFMNDDTEVISNDWIERMASFAIQPEVGAVGPRLLYPNDRIQNNGLLFIRQVHNEKHSAGDFVAPYYRNTHKNQNLGVGTVLSASIRDYSAITGAVLMIQKKKHIQINGWNEGLPIAFNDVDYCLKLNELHLYNVINPNVECIHIESASIGAPSNSRIKQLHIAENMIKRKWKKIINSDSFGNRHLYLLNGRLLIDP